MNSFLYPQTIEVRRTTRPQAGGLQGYGASTKETDVKVFGPVPANISEARQARPVPHGVPDAAMFRGLYLIVFRANRGLVRTKDIVIDEQSNRYELVTVSWGFLGYSVIGELLEV